MPREINESSKDYRKYCRLYSGLKKSSARVIQEELDNPSDPIDDLNIYIVDFDTKYCSPLQQAVRFNNLAGVTVLADRLKSHPKVIQELLTYQAGNGETPLVTASGQGNVDIIGKLMAMGADITAVSTNADSRTRKTVLARAASAISSHSLMHYCTWDQAGSNPVNFKNELRDFERHFYLREAVPFPKGNHTVTWNAQHQFSAVETLLTSLKNNYLTATDPKEKATLLDTFQNFKKFFKNATINPETFLFNADGPKTEFQVIPGNPNQDHVMFSCSLLNMHMDSASPKIAFKVNKSDFQQYVASVNKCLEEMELELTKLTGKQVQEVISIHQAAIETQQSAQRTQKEVDNKLAILENKEREIEREQKAKHDAFEQRQRELEQKEKERAAKEKKEEELKHQAEVRKKQIEAFKATVGTRTFFNRIDKRFKHRARAVGGLDDGLTQRTAYSKADTAASIAGGLLGILSSTAGKAASGGIKMASNKHEAGKHDRFVENVPSNEVAFCENIAYRLTLEYQSKLSILNQERARAIGTLARDIMYEKLAEKVYQLSDQDMETLAVDAVKTSKKFGEVLTSAYTAQLQDNAKLEAAQAKKQGANSLQGFTAYTASAPSFSQQPAQLRPLMQPLRVT